MIMRYSPYFAPPQGGCHPQMPIEWNGANTLLSPPECLAIIEAHNKPERLSPGLIGNGDNSMGVNSPGYRKVEKARVQFKEFGWLYDKVAQKVQLANQHYFRFDLTGFGEEIEFLKYTAAVTSEQVPGHYDWHLDFGGGLSSNRKLSMVVQLSRSKDYTGCELRYFAGQGEVRANLYEQGDAVMFPSWVPHRVTSIDTGTRYALAIWVHGPQFR